MAYVSALVLFFLMHVVPFKPEYRKRFSERYGELGYKVRFRFIILGIVVMGIYGWSRFPNIYFYEPDILLKRIHLVLMAIAVYLWVAAEIPNNLKRHIRHPMLIGTVIWGIGHLLANGDLRSMLLFVCFLIFSLIAIVQTNKRDGERELPPKRPIKYDIIVCGVAILVYGLFIKFHGNLFGMPINHYFYW